ncbi:MAG: hypothetical protein ABIJ18_05260 [archaeon]
MKKLIVIMAIFILMLSSFASAGFWDWFTGNVIGVQEGEEGGGGDSGGDSGGGDSGGDSGGSDGSSDGGFGEGGGDEGSGEGGGDPNVGGSEPVDGGGDGGVSGEGGGDDYDHGDGGNYVYDGPAPGAGCNPDSYWDGQSCVQREGYYQQGRPATDFETGEVPGSGCLEGNYWDGENCVWGGEVKETICNPDSNWDGEKCVLIPGYYPKQEEGWCKDGQCCPDGFCDDFEKRTNGCPIDCGGVVGGGGPYGACVDDEKVEELKKKCHDHGGMFDVQTNKDCTQTRCDFGDAVKDGGGFINRNCDGIESEVIRCEEVGMEANVHQSCAVECVPYGTKNVGFVEKEIPAAEALQVILKVDKVKIKLKDMQKKIEELAKYYEKEGDVETADQYNNAAESVVEVQNALDNLKDSMKTKIEEKGSLQIEDIYEFKGMLRKIVDDSLTQIVYSMLGVDTSLLQEETVEAESCGENEFCFEDVWSACAVGSSFNPESGITIRIVDKENGLCKVDVELLEGTAHCSFEEHIHKYTVPSKELFDDYCGEEFKAMIGDMEGPGGGPIDRHFEDGSYDEEPNYNEEYYEETVEEPSIEEETSDNVFEETIEETVEETPTEEPTSEEVI